MDKDNKEIHFITNVIVLNVLVPFFVFIYTQTFFNIYNPYMDFPLSERIALALYKNFFLFVFIGICIPFALVTGYFLQPVKKAINDSNLIEKAKSRIFWLPILQFSIYMSGFLSGFIIAYSMPGVVPLNDWVYVFSVTIFSGLFGVLFSLILTDYIMFDVKKVYNMQIIPDKQNKIPLTAKFVITVLTSGLFIWSITAYIGYFYFKKGNNIDTGDYFFNVLINVLIIIAGSFVIAFLIGTDLSKMVKYMRNSIEEIIKGKGDLTKRINIISFDEIGLLTSDFNRLLEYLNNMVDNIYSIAKKVDNSKAILSQSIEGNKVIFEAFLTSIDKILHGITSSFDETTKLQDISDKIYQSSIQINQSVEKQQQAAQYSSASTEEMSGNIKSVSDIAKQANNYIINLLTDIGGTKKNLKESINAINLINQSSNDLLQFVNAISDISERIKLLAINASIEAARAGRSGEGFAVVAIEVRKLSESSSNSVRNIELKINDMNDVISSGTGLINDTWQTLEKIFKRIEDMARIIEEVATSMDEQEIGTQTIEKSMIDVLESTLSLFELVQKSKEQSHNLTSVSNYFIQSSKEIFSLAGDQKEKNEQLIGINHDLVNAFDSMKTSFSELEKILAEFKTNSH
ncbi:MAG: hypothetical protein A2086_04385 [Spirochaetes bacterium GWD1_27_9]|nr:MAG: hypothetical protein A2Z98_12150 [Spirochaetes bacterium GWB1_27_13]OHD26005.1 MAG: hypothetical protein A2Y34_00670 [Spirochaetes bacterium GWC1_27_15]OHD32324.1 MAG: hypothetical protein A2086_04385 [Spirochaetes bacterium GWD1_27_9]